MTVLLDYLSSVNSTGFEYIAYDQKYCRSGGVAVANISIENLSSYCKDESIPATDMKGGRPPQRLWQQCGAGGYVFLTSALPAWQGPHHVSCDAKWVG